MMPIQAAGALLKVIGETIAIPIALTVRKIVADRPDSPVGKPGLKSAEGGDERRNGPEKQQPPKFQQWKSPENSSRFQEPEKKMRTTLEQTGIRPSRENETRFYTEPMRLASHVVNRVERPVPE